MYEYSKFGSYSLTKYLKCAYKKAKIPPNKQKTQPVLQQLWDSLYIIEI